MGQLWHWFIIAATFISLGFFLWLLLANRRTEGGKTGHEWDGIEEFDNPLPAWWVWMFVISIIWTVGYLVIYPGLGNFDGATSWSSQGEHAREAEAHTARFAPLYASLGAMAPEELATSTEGMQVGRRLFINNCSTCHGVNAGGAVGFPNLRDEHWIWGGDIAAIQHTINNGRQAAMPAWGPALGNDGVTNVANFVMQLAGKAHDAERAAAGAPQFATFCVSCHGVEGKGNALLGAPDITSGIWMYGDDLQSVAETIRNGRAGMMPGFTDILGEDQRKILAAYVKSLSE